MGTEMRGEETGRYGRFEVYELYIVGTMRDDFERYLEEIMAALDRITAKHFDAPFGYIADRVHRPAASAQAYLMARRRYPLWSAIGIVSYSSMTERFAPIEATILGGLPLEVFRERSEAEQWMSDKIRQLRGAAESTGS